MKIVNKYYFKYILLISVLVVLFVLIYKKILMYLLFNDFFTKQDIKLINFILINMNHFLINIIIVIITIFQKYHI